jgi:hypothetical protein
MSFTPFALRAMPQRELRLLYYAQPLGVATILIDKIRGFPPLDEKATFKEEEKRLQGTQIDWR